MATQISQEEYQKYASQVQSGGQAAKDALAYLTGKTIAPSAPKPVTAQPASSAASGAISRANQTYSGSASVIGNVNGASDTNKAYQGIYDSVRASDPSRNQLNTWQGANGDVYDTTKMTTQQAYALQLNKSGNPNAAKILDGMGLDINGNPLSKMYADIYNRNNSQGNSNYIPSTVSTVGSAIAPNAAPVQQSSANAPAIPPNLQSYQGGDGKTLAQYQQDIPAAKQEILRAKQVYDKAMSEGRTADAQAAHVWADHIRQYTNIDVNDGTYGNAPVAGSTQPNQSVTPSGQTGTVGGSNDFINMFKDAFQEQASSQIASLEQAKNDALARIEAAHRQAISDGEMSVREADAALEKAKKEVDQQAYQSYQAIQSSAAQRGIGNSQQLLGMEATGQGQAMQAKSAATSARDQAVSDIQTRIRQLNQQATADANTVLSNADQAKIKAKADASAGFLNAAGQFQMQDYFSDKGFGQQLKLADVGFQNQSKLLDKQTSAELEKMAKGQEYDVEKMGIDQKNKKEIAVLAHTLGLEDMAAKFGYDSKLQSQQDAAASSRQAASLKAQSDGYDQAVARELSKYTPGTPEYTIRQAQLKEEADAKKKSMMADFIFKAEADQALNNPNLPAAEAAQRDGTLVPPPDLNQYPSLGVSNIFNLDSWKDTLGNITNPQAWSDVLSTVNPFSNKLSKNEYGTFSTAIKNKLDFFNK